MTSKSHDFLMEFIMNRKCKNTTGNVQMESDNRDKPPRDRLTIYLWEEWLQMYNE